MSAHITRLDLANRWRSLVGYSLGMALYTLVVVALYPAFKHSTSLDEFVASDPTAAALFGVTGSLTSPDGWLNGNVFANFLPLVMLLLTIGYGAAALAGQDEDGTLCLVVVLPIRRRAVVLEKAAAMTVQALVLAATVAVVVVLGRAFDVTIPLSNVLSVSVAVALMGLDLGLVAMAVGAVTAAEGLHSESAPPSPLRRTSSAPWLPSCPGSSPRSTHHFSTGRSATTSSARASPRATTPSCSACSWPLSTEPWPPSVVSTSTDEHRRCWLGTTVISGNDRSRLRRISSDLPCDSS